MIIHDIVFQKQRTFSVISLFLCSSCIIMATNMVKSLRSLGLLKVSSLGLNFEDLPPGLVKDLKIMKLFNGNFSESYEDTHGNGVDTVALQTAITIQYDGESWTFKSRSNLSLISCCINCDAGQPVLHQFTVKEGEPVKLKSPFVFVQQWILASWLEIAFAGLTMTLSVNMKEEGTSGELVFGGCSRSVFFSSIMKMDFTKQGSRVLSHRGEGNSLFGPLHFFRDRLNQSTGLDKIGFKFYNFLPSFS